MVEYDEYLSNVIQREEALIEDMYKTINTNIGLKQLRELRAETIARWERVGLLEGLSGNVDENCAKLFESQLSWVMKE